MKFFSEVIVFCILSFMLTSVSLQAAEENKPVTASVNPDQSELSENTVQDKKETKNNISKERSRLAKLAESFALLTGKGSEAAADVERKVHSFFGFEIAGFPIDSLLFSFLALLLTLAVRRVFARYIIVRCIKIARRAKTDLDEQFIDTLEKPLTALILIVGIYFSISLLPLTPSVSVFVGKLFNALIMLALVWGAVRVTDILSAVLENKITHRYGEGLAGFTPLVHKTLRIFVLVIGILVTVDNLGYDVTGIIATLGLGTAALALASQDTIKNGFGALMIMLDRPFKVGDWIQVGDKVDGTIEAIGLRSTKVRTFAKTLISIPNGVLANEYINNFTRMPKRRVKQVIGISYEATAKDMENIVADIKKLLCEDEDIHKEFILVNFTDFGESSLDVLVYYFTTTTVWLDFMEVQQRMNLKIMKAVEARGLSVAFPTRTLYLDGEAANKIAGSDYTSRWKTETQAAVKSPGAEILPSEK
ncbi:MAG: mechanosensitive ion channel family protein [Chthoniobacterales bacterium]